MYAIYIYKVFTMGKVKSIFGLVCPNSYILNYL